MSRTALVAIGGNSLIRAGEKGTIAEQLANTRRTARAIVGLIGDGFSLVLTHGNGPQVGAALLRSERASDQQAAGIRIPVVTVLSQVIVSADDPAMRHPTKPIGPFYSRTDAEERARLHGWQVVEDAARGYRRVVPSPDPIEVVEEPVIRGLLAQGVLVVAAGGGGIPVVRTPEGLEGVEAVIDKDRVSALLAGRLGVDCFIISTDADCVYVDYRKPTQRPLGRVSASEIEGYRAAGQFPPGNMGPKVESALRFLRSGGKEVIITSYEYLRAAARGEAGTRLVTA
jgi:carbamate kinase